MLGHLSPSNNNNKCPADSPIDIKAGEASFDLPSKLYFVKCGEAIGEGGEAKDETRKVFEGLKGIFCKGCLYHL